MTSGTQQSQQPGGNVILGAVATVAAVYVYFLIFAQFGFLQAVRSVLGEEVGVIRPIMTTMGLAGVTGSGLAAVFFSEAGSRRRLAAGFGVCAVAAVWSLGAKNPAGFHGAAALTGLGAGLTTVTLAGMLRGAVGGGRLGMIIGLGTGLAYGFCNLPGVFDATATTQAQLALLAAAAGWAGGGRLASRFQRETSTRGDYSQTGLAAWMVIFVTLVCLDSAAFYVIQHTPAPREAMWTGAGRLALNAGLHLGVAVLAGWALDRGWLGWTVGLGAGALVAACWLIAARPPTHAWAGLLYVTGISVYSTGLVYYPARSGRAGVAALVYTVAGWGGSALGIGLAVGRPRVEASWAVAAGGLVLLGLIGRNIHRRRVTQPCLCR